MAWVRTPQCIRGEEEVSTSKRKHYGLCWPLFFLRRGEVDISEVDLVEDSEEEEEEVGLVRDSKFGTPSGAIECFGSNVKKVAGTREAVNSDQATDAEFGSAWGSMKRSIGKTQIEVKQGEGEGVGEHLKLRAN